MSDVKKSIYPKLTPTRLIITGYLTVILAGALLLSLPQATVSGSSTPFIDALFTSASAVCVTGLIVVNTATHWSMFGQVVILVLIQIGGIGIMSISTLAILFFGRKIGLSQRLLVKEDVGYFSQAGLTRLIRYIVTLTLTIEAIGALFLFSKLRHQMATGRAIWFSIFHSVSAFCNAGFDIFGDSLETFTSSYTINFTVIGLIILGGIGFTVIYDIGDKIITGKPLKSISFHTKIVLIVTLLLLLGGLAVILALETGNPETIGELEGSHRLLASFFLSVTPRTAGFNTVPTGALRVSTLIFIVFFMYVGASPGSTGGGIKTTTFAALIGQLYSYIRGRRNVSMYKRRLSETLIREAMVISFLAIALVFTASFVLSITENAEFIDILFESTSAFGTVGLSTGITGSLSRLGRIVIIITMFAGRLGPLTLAIGLSRAKDNQAGYRYPVEDIMVG